MDAPGPLVLVRWEAPAGDAHRADHLAKVALRHLRRASAGGTRPGLCYAAFGLFALVFILAVGVPAVLPVLVGVGVMVLLVQLGPRRIAKSWRRQPTFNDPYSVTLDAEGTHIVGPSSAEHVRWRVYESVAIDGDTLVLLRRGVRFVRVLPLVHLDPRIDRAWLEQEVRRLIEADAVHAAV